MQTSRVREFLGSRRAGGVHCQHRNRILKDRIVIQRAEAARAADARYQSSFLNAQILSRDRQAAEATIGGKSEEEAGQRSGKEVVALIPLRLAYFMLGSLFHESTKYHPLYYPLF